MSLSIKINAKEWIDRLDLAAREKFYAIRRGLMQAGREARSQALTTFGADANIESARAKRTVARVTNPGGGLVARWEPRSRAANLGSTTGASWSRATGLNASTFVLTGGGSAPLNAPRGFMIVVGGKKIVLNRVASGHRTGYHKVFAERLNAGMGQDNAAPRKTWQVAAAREADVKIAAELQKVFDGSTPSAATE